MYRLRLLGYLFIICSIVTVMSSKVSESHSIECRILCKRLSNANDNFFESKIHSLNCECSKLLKSR